MTDSSIGGTAADFGVIGLGVMGANLALNIADHGFRVAVWNRTTPPIEELLAANPGKGLVGQGDLAEFVASLERPRRILMMIKAGAPVDQMLDALTPLLAEGDIVIDGGNSWFEDTERRERHLAGAGIRFFGMGVSGGEEGARRGPALMPGGDFEAYERLRPVLEAIAARTEAGPCVTHCGPGGAGHFVKMVHNGIEYGDMQLIAEAYDIMRKGLGMGAEEIGAVFEDWNFGVLESYLIDLTAKVLRKKDLEGAPLVDQVLDRAGQKGTGKWTVRVALELGIAIPTITAAVDARFISADRDARREAAMHFDNPDVQWEAGTEKRIVHDIGYSLFASKICSYAQGMELLRAASDNYQWDTNPREVVRSWKAGCIIRAKLLDHLMHAFDRNGTRKSLLLDPQLVMWLTQMQPSWRRLVGMAQLAGIPVPALSASLNWFDGRRSEFLPQNLTQAQRDAFGAHGFKLLEDPDGEDLHSDWLR